MKPARFPDRYRAAAAHFGVVAAIALALFILIYFVWYPKGLFASAGGRGLFVLIALTNLVVGPVLTFVVYKPGKKGLAFDLWVIAILQVAALGYGLYVLQGARPVYLVFVKDRFELVRANELPPQNLAGGSAYAELPLDGPRIVGARLPGDPAGRARIIDAIAVGIDLHHFPQHYVDYASVRDEARARATTIARLRELNPGAARDIDGLVAASGLPEAKLGVLPVRAGKIDLAAIIELQGAELVTIVALRPWSHT